MKKIMTGLFIPLIVSMFFGFISAKLVYRVYGDELENKLSSSKLYLIQNGKYLTYDSMREENSANNYIYYKDEEGYKTVIGITHDANNIDKISNLYDNNVNIEEYYVSNELLDEKQHEYDMMLANTNNIHEVKEVVDNILNLYRENDTIRLILVD